MAEFEIDTEDLSADAILQKIAAEHDGVREVLDEHEEASTKAQHAESAAEELDLDDTSDLADKIGLLQEKVSDLRSKVDGYEEDDMREHAEYIAERTDRFGDDAEEVLASHDDLEDIEETRELVEDLSEATDEKTVSPGADKDGDDTGPQQKYAKTPWS